MTTVTGDKLSEIRKHLAYIVAEMQIANGVNLTDSSIKLERFFKQVLNSMYGFNLTDANFQICNAWAIDLKDDANRICYQISATNTTRKIKDTITKFKEKNLHSNYDALVFLFLTNDNPCSAADPDLANPIRTNLYFKSVSGLYKDIAGLNEAHISQIHKLITSEVVLPRKYGVLPGIDSPVVNLPSVQKIIDAMNLGDDHVTIKQLVGDMTDLTSRIDLLEPAQKNVIFKFMKLCSYKTNRGGYEQIDEIFISRRSFLRVFTLEEQDWLYSLKTHKLFIEADDYWTDPDTEESVVIVTFSGRLDATNLFGWLKHVVNGNQEKMREMFCSSNYQCLSI